MVTTKLTPKQLDLIHHIKNYSSDLGYYAECGKYKPWNVKTIQSLIDKKIIEFHEANDVNENRYEQYYFLTMKQS